MTDVHVSAIGDGPRVVFVHGSMSTGLATFEPQRELAGSFRLEFVDRRGFGDSPARPGGVDFERDADDVLELLAIRRDHRGAHLVGHSYGAVVALVAAARNPALVRSLTVIEPPAFGLARGDAAVGRMEERMRRVFPAPAGAAPRAWYVSFLRGMGLTVPDDLPLSGKDVADIEASMNERFPGEAQPDLAAIRRAAVPVLVFRGDWSGAGEGARELAGAAFAAICEAVATGTGGRLVVVAGAAHNPQLTQPVRFNGTLLPFLRDAEARRSAGEAPPSAE